MKAFQGSHDSKEGYIIVFEEAELDFLKSGEMVVVDLDCMRIVMGMEGSEKLERNFCVVTREEYAALSKGSSRKN